MVAIDDSESGVAMLKRKAGFWTLVLSTFQMFADPDTSPRCAATAFFGFLAIFPAIATVALVYGLVADRAIVADTISALHYVLPSPALGLLHDQLSALEAQPRQH
jgi:membrane protein